MCEKQMQSARKRVAPSILCKVLRESLPFGLQLSFAFFCHCFLCFFFFFFIFFFILLFILSLRRNNSVQPKGTKNVNYHLQYLNNDSSPKYLKDMLTLRQSKYSLRGTNILSLCNPVTTTYGLNSFRYFASKTWNSLSNNVRSEHTLTGFRRLLKAISF